MATYQMGLTRWREGAEAMRDLESAAGALSKWIDRAGDVVNAAADAERQAEPMVHPGYQAEGFWVPADHWRPLTSALDELR